jgi:hypothetical protein
MHWLYRLSTHSFTQTAKVDITLADRAAALYPCLISSDRKTADAAKVPLAAASWATLIFWFLLKNVAVCLELLNRFRCT